MGWQGFTRDKALAAHLGRYPLALLEVAIIPTRETVDPRAGMPQAKQLPRGAQPLPSAENWIKALLSKALPTRTRTSFSHCQSLPSGSLHKPLSLIHQRADRRSKKTNSPTAAKTKTTLQKVNYNEKVECYVSDEGTK